jgi:hypothetical protein
VNPSDDDTVSELTAVSDNRALDDKCEEGDKVAMCVTEEAIEFVRRAEIVRAGE